MPRTRAAATAHPLRIAAWLIAGALATAGAAAEPVGYVIGEVPGDGPGLFELDLSTGELTPKGPPLGGPGAAFPQLALAPDGTLYGVEDFGRQLLRIDPATGIEEIVAPMDLFDPSVSFTGMTFDACGRLFITARRGSLPVFRHVLLQVDPQTGAVTELSPPGSERVFSVAARGEELFVWTAAGLARIDPRTQLPVQVGPLPDELGGPLDFDVSGVLWGYGLLPPGPPPSPPPLLDIIRQVDPATGAAGDPIATLPIGHVGLAIAPPIGVCVSGSPLAVPTLSAGGIAALVLSLLVLGTILLRRTGAVAGPTS